MSTLIGFPVEILQTIALKLDPCSLVSFSLTSKAFECYIWHEECVEYSQTAPRYGILGIPSSVMGIGICEEAVKYDLVELFDYWCERVRINIENSIASMLRYAGLQVSKERSLFWVGKIYMFCYSRPNLAKDSTDRRDDFCGFVHGVITSDDVEKYKFFQSLPTDEGDDEDADEREVRSLPQMRHMVIALEEDALNIAEYIGQTSTLRIFASQDCWEPIISSTISATSLRWFLDKIPSDLDLSVKIFRLNMILTKSVLRFSAEKMMVVFTHSLFLDVPDEKIVMKHPLPSNVALEILSLRPRLVLTCLNFLTSLWNKHTKILDPRAEQYLKIVKAADVIKILKNCLVPLSVAKTLLERFPIGSDCDTNDFDDIFSLLVQENKFKDVVKAFANSYPWLLEMIKRKWSHKFYTLVGEDIFPDDVIVAAIREAKQSEQEEDVIVRKNKDDEMPAPKKGTKKNL